MHVAFADGGAAMLDGLESCDGEKEAGGCERYSENSGLYGSNVSLRCLGGFSFVMRREVSWRYLARISLVTIIRPSFC
jgi:hypothetical protein